MLTSMSNNFIIWLVDISILWVWGHTLWYQYRLGIWDDIWDNFCELHISALTHWGRVTHICVSNLTIIGLDNGLSPGRRQAIIWTNVGQLLIGPLRTNFSEIIIEILTSSFKKMRLKVSSGKWRPFCVGLNELTKSLQWSVQYMIGTQCKFP